MIKVDGPIRILTIVAGAAYAATLCGERFEDFKPKPPTSVGTVVSTTSAAGSAVVMNPITFSVVVVTPPFDRRDTFKLT